MNTVARLLLIDVKVETQMPETALSAVPEVRA